MNILFTLVFFTCTTLLLCSNPQFFLSTLLDASSDSASLCLSLLATYAVWLGLMKVWEQSGVSRAVSKWLKPVAKRLFKTDDNETLDAVCMNASVNMLGISGAATPYGILSAKLLDKAPHAEYSSAMLFVINATSIQILPTSIISVRVALHSANPTDIVLPTLITSLFSTLLAVLLVRVFIPPKREHAPVFTPNSYVARGAGTQ